MPEDEGHRQSGSQEPQMNEKMKLPRSSLNYSLRAGVHSEASNETSSEDPVPNFYNSGSIED